MRSSLLMVLFAALAGVAEGAPVQWSFTFDTGPPPELQLDGARVTNTPGQVLEGQGSLLADFATADGEWHEYLHTRPAIRFEKGKTYYVSYRIRIVAMNDDPQTEFYDKLRSRAGQGDIDAGRWLWRTHAGDERTLHRIFEVDKDDCFLILGIRRRGTVIIDNLRIRETVPPPPVGAFQVKSGVDKVGPLRRHITALRKADNLESDLDDMVVIFCNEGGGLPAIQRTPEFMDRFNIDFVDWNRLAPIARSRGVRTSTGGPEYQEFYPQENPKFAENAFEALGDSGFQITLSNTYVRHDEWLDGGVYVCHNGDTWHKHFIQRTWQMAGHATAICQDNIANAPWNAPHPAGFCPGCQSGFREYLKERYSPAELRPLGVNNLDAFDAREYFLTHGLVGQKGAAHPLVREYIKYQNLSQTLRWAECVSAFRSAASNEGRTLPVYGNQIGIASHSFFAVLLSQFNDIVEIEEVTGVGERPDNKVFEYKMGLASTNHERPVWVRGPVIDTNTDPEGPMVKTLYWDVHFGEALANGGVRVYSVGYNRPRLSPDLKHYHEYGDLMDYWEEFARFTRRNRSLFIKRDSAARVAVVFSLPSSIPRHFPTLSIHDDGRIHRARAWSDQLDRWHVPHDALVFGHSELFDDAKTLERLKRYDLVLLPNADAMTEAQVQALLQYRIEGGAIRGAGELGTLDENLNPRLPQFVPDFGSESRLPGASLDPIRDLLIAKSGVETELPETVSVNLWRGQVGRSLDIHLVNYEINVPMNQAYTVENPSLTVEIPRGVSFSNAYLFRPFHDRVEIPIERDGAKVRLQLPELETYAVVSLTTENRLIAGQAEAEKRRAADRERVKEEARKFNLERAWRQ